MRLYVNRSALSHLATETYLQTFWYFCTINRAEERPDQRR